MNKKTIKTSRIRNQYQFCSRALSNYKRIKIGTPSSTDQAFVKFWMEEPIYIRKPFRAIDYKFDARSNQCVFAVSRALFDLDYYYCSVNKLNFHADMPQN